MRIVFMGTANFAVPALLALIEKQHNIVAVYTKAPQPAGRGYGETKSPIHLLAIENNLPVITPVNFKNAEDVLALQELQPDVIIVAAYGLILPQKILDIPTFGCLNIHPSLLPRWRGAAPLQRTIMAGDKETAVCIMQMDAGMDTGNIIIQQNLPLATAFTIHDLTEITAKIGAELLLDVLSELSLQQKPLLSVPQSKEGITIAHKINKQEERINWQQNANEIECLIRALTPRVHFIYQDEMIRIIDADVVEHAPPAMPGTVVDDNLLISCGKGAIRPNILQRQGRKVIYREAFLRGFNLPIGTVLA